MINKRAFSFYISIIAPLLLLLPILIQGNALFWGTPSLQFIPWQIFEARSVVSGQIPWWNPYNGMGSPLIANYQSAFFYPFTWILWLVFLLGGVSWLAWANTIVLLIHLWIAALGMRQLVKYWGLSEIAQVIGAVCFSLSGYIVCRLGFFSMVYAAVWLPWMIYLIEIILSSSDRKTIYQTGLKLVLVIVMLLFAGHAQTAFYAILFSGLWVLFLGWARFGLKRSAISTGILATAVLIAVLLTSIQLIPTFEYLQNSQRSSAVDYDTVVTYSFSPLKILTFLIPDLFGNPGTGNYRGYASYWEDAVYIGVIPFVLALSTLSSSLFRKKKEAVVESGQNRIAIFLWIGVITSIVFAFGKYSPVFPYFYNHIPFFDMFKAPARYLFITIFCMVLLAVLGAERIKKPIGRSLFWTRLGVAGAVAISIGATAGMLLLPKLDPALFLGALQVSGLLTLFGLLKLSAPEEKKPFSFWLLAGTVIIIFDILLFGSKAIPSISASQYLVSTPASSSSGRLYISQKDEYTFKIHRFFRFADFNLIETGNAVFTAGLPNVNLIDNSSTANNFDPLVANEYLTWMNFLDQLPANKLESWLMTMGVDRWRKFAPESTAGYLDVPIRGSSNVKWYSCARKFDSTLPLSQTLGMLERDEIDSAIFIDNNVAIGAQNCTALENAKINTIKKEATIIEYKVISSIDGWLFTSDLYYPGWKAYVDDFETPIVRANYLFRSVYLPKGTHYVKYVYQPDWQPALITVTIVSWFIYAGVWVFSKRKFNQRGNHG